MAFSGSTGKSASGESIMQGEGQVWNISDGFTKINILKPLIEITLYEVIAKFGVQNSEERINFTNNEISQRRIDGFDRLIFTLRQVIGNCAFAIKNDKSKNVKDLEALNSLILRIDQVESSSASISRWSQNQVTKEDTLEISEKHFRVCLDILMRIKEELNAILNRAGLIFRKGEETDLDELSNSIIEG